MITICLCNPHAEPNAGRAANCPVHSAAAAGMRNCDWCVEPLDGPDDLEYMHRECAFRAITGSVAHIEKRCSCFVLGSTELDPPEMSKREAAKAAFLAYRKLHSQLFDARACETIQ